MLASSPRISAAQGANGIGKLAFGRSMISQPARTSEIPTSACGLGSEHVRIHHRTNPKSSSVAISRRRVRHASIREGRSRLHGCQHARGEFNRPSRSREIDHLQPVQIRARISCCSHHTRSLRPSHRSTRHRARAASTHPAAQKHRPSDSRRDPRRRLQQQSLPPPPDRDPSLEIAKTRA